MFIVNRQTNVLIQIIDRFGADCDVIIRTRDVTGTFNREYSRPLLTKPISSYHSLSNQIIKKHTTYILKDRLYRRDNLRTFIKLGH